MAGFEVYRKPSSRAGIEPAVSVQRGGNFSLNSGACQLLGKPAAVELLYDRSARLIGFRPAGAEAPHAYRLRPQKEGTSLRVSGGAFARHYGISTAVTRRYPATMVGDVLAVDVTEEGLTTGRHAEEAAAS